MTKEDRDQALKNQLNGLAKKITASINDYLTDPDQPNNVGDKIGIAICAMEQSLLSVFYSFDFDVPSMLETFKANVMTEHNSRRKDTH